MKNSIGVVSIATNIYLKYWRNQVNSIDEFFRGHQKVTVHLFTDQVIEAKLHAKSLKNIHVVVHKIEALGWPDATLLRYSLISEISDDLKSFEILMYLDADMQIVSPIDMAELSKGTRDLVTLVRHPGYYRPNRLEQMKQYLATPKLMIADVMIWLRFGGLGAWETSQKSKAYVRRNQRRNYYCGGVWWGNSDAVLQLAEELAVAVERDKAARVQAVWHDESHLNRWAVDNNHFEVGPEYCFAPAFKWLAGLKPIIVAVDKDLRTR